MTHFITLFLMSIGVLFTSPNWSITNQYDSSEKSKVSRVATYDMTTTDQPTGEGGNEGWDDE